MEGFKAKFAMFVATALEVVKAANPEAAKDPDGYLDGGEFLDELSNVLEYCGVVIPTIPIRSTVYCVLENDSGDYYISEETVKGIALHNGKEYVFFDDTLELFGIDNDYMFPTLEEAEARIEILKKEAAQ